MTTNIESKKKLAIIGAGESGVGAALLAKVNNYDVFVSDASEIQDKYEEMLSKNQIDFEDGQHTEKMILDAQEIIKSPGVPYNIPILKKAKELQIPIISELNLPLVLPMQKLSQSQVAMVKLPPHC